MKIYNKDTSGSVVFYNTEISTTVAAGASGETITGSIVHAQTLNATIPYSWFVNGNASCRFEISELVTIVDTAVTQTNVRVSNYFVLAPVFNWTVRYADALSKAKTIWVRKDDALALAKNITVKNDLVPAPPVYTQDGTTSLKAANSAVELKTQFPGSTTGWYWLMCNGTPKQFYVDMDFEGGGWILVASKNINVTTPGWTYAQSAQGYDHLGSTGFVIGTTDPKTNTTWVGLNAWNALTTANNAGKNFIYLTASSAIPLSGTPARRTRWKWTGWSGTFQWTGVNSLVNDVGGVTPDLYAYSIVNNYGFTTYDVKNDVYTSNCASSYNNAPWWYGACWSGNIWGGNGIASYGNAAYWTGSGTDYYNYGAMYIK
jgi:hypothetical protein